MSKQNKNEKPPAPPKRPMSAYFQYLNDMRQRIVKENQTASVAEISKIAGAEWREVDPKTKSKYQKKADKAREEYEIIKAEYEKKFGSIKKIARKRKLDEKSQKKTRN